jgi:hypothetical protein
MVQRAMTANGHSMYTATVLITRQSQSCVFLLFLARHSKSMTDFGGVSRSAGESAFTVS